MGQLHLVAFFLQKMIPAETRYKTYDGELLPIVETFSTWKHYLEGSLYEMFILTDYNNLHRFMDTKSLSFRQSARPKNSFITTFKSIIVRAKLTELLMPCLDTFNKVQKKKRHSAPRMSKSSTTCNCF